MVVVITSWSDNNPLNSTEYDLFTVFVPSDIEAVRVPAEAKGTSTLLPVTVITSPLFFWYVHVFTVQSPGKFIVTVVSVVPTDSVNVGASIGSVDVCISLEVVVKLFPVTLDWII